MIKLLGEKANKTEIDAMVRDADSNGDGTVDFEGERRGKTAPAQLNLSIFGSIIKLDRQKSPNQSQKDAFLICRSALSSNFLLNAEEEECFFFLHHSS